MVFGRSEDATTGAEAAAAAASDEVELCLVEGRPCPGKHTKGNDNILVSTSSSIYHTEYSLSFPLSLQHTAHTDTLYRHSILHTRAAYITHMVYRLIDKTIQGYKTYCNLYILYHIPIGACHLCRG